MYKNSGLQLSGLLRAAAPAPAAAGGHTQVIAGNGITVTKSGVNSTVAVNNAVVALDADVNTSLALKADTTAVNLKANTADVTASLALKADRTAGQLTSATLAGATTVNGTTSFNDNITVANNKDITRGAVSVFSQLQQKVTNNSQASVKSINCDLPGGVGQLTSGLRVGGNNNRTFDIQKGAGDEFQFHWTGTEFLRVSSTGFAVQQSNFSVPSGFDFTRQGVGVFATLGTKANLAGATLTDVQGITLAANKEITRGATNLFGSVGANTTAVGLNLTKLNNLAPTAIHVQPHSNVADNILRFAAANVVNYDAPVGLEVYEDPAVITIQKFVAKSNAAQFNYKVMLSGFVNCGTDFNSTVLFKLPDGIQTDVNGGSIDDVRPKKRKLFRQQGQDTSPANTNVGMRVDVLQNGDVLVNPGGIAGPNCDLISLNGISYMTGADYT